MKMLIFALTQILFISSAQALTFSLLNPCTGEAVLKLESRLEGVQSAGEVTEKILQEEKIPYQGGASGFVSILGTPIGENAMEIISDSEMRIYGWCYSVNGVQPDIMPDKKEVVDADQIEWLYGYSHYKSGQWVSYCDPAYKVRPAFLCEKLN